MIRANNFLSTLLRCLFQAELKRPVKVGAPLMNSWMIKLFDHQPVGQPEHGSPQILLSGAGRDSRTSSSICKSILVDLKLMGVFYTASHWQRTVSRKVFVKLWFTDPILRLMSDTCVAFRVCLAWVTDLWSGVNPIRSASCDCSSSCSLIHSLIHSQMVSFPPDYQSCIQPAQNPSLQ